VRIDAKRCCRFWGRRTVALAGPRRLRSFPDSARLHLLCSLSQADIAISAIHIAEFVAAEVASRVSIGNSRTPRNPSPSANGLRCPPDDTETMQVRTIASARQIGRQAVDQCADRSRAHELMRLKECQAKHAIGWATTANCRQFPNFRGTIATEDEGLMGVDQILLRWSFSACRKSGAAYDRRRTAA